MRTVAAGDALLSPAVTRRVIEDYAQRTVARNNNKGLDSLTERELEVLRLLATGKSNAELAQELFLGEGTIKTHVSHLLAKLGLRDRVQAVVFAYESGLDLTRPQLTTFQMLSTRVADWRPDFTNPAADAHLVWATIHGLVTIELIHRRWGGAVVEHLQGDPEDNYATAIGSLLEALHGR